jgi:hypothetical protein
MTITPTHNERTNTFNVEHEGKHYHVTIWLNEASSKFQDWEVIDSHGNKADFDTEDAIITKIDEDWHKLV